jgi:hypothetical protein
MLTTDDIIKVAIACSLWQNAISLISCLVFKYFSRHKKDKMEILEIKIPTMVPPPKKTRQKIHIKS